MPTLIRTQGRRRQDLHPWAGINTALAHLAALDLEQALEGVLVFTQQPGNSTVASIRQIGNHTLGPRSQALIFPISY